uniref:molecular chaperone DnaJ n=1 Tax=Bacillaceae bacterium JMAK1 TaxID=1028381 RepID=UPI00155DC673|nr:molecular chaperone DnaJ [Bacillaceae bacterium JMAK1]
MKFFQSVKTLEDLKAEYRKLAKKLHPDTGGNHDDFIQMKAEYERVAEGFASKDDYKGFASIIDSLIKYDNISIEIIGDWIWVSGKTYEIKLELKSLDFHYAKKKKAWYWHDGSYQKRHKRNYSLDEIRDMHDSKTIKQNKVYLEL